MVDAVIPAPPRLTGTNPTEDTRAILQWAYQLYQMLEISQRVISRLNAIGGVDQLTQTISATPTQAQVEAIQSKINEIITAASL